MTKRAAFHTLGCKVNTYETDAMQQMLEEAGYTIVPFSEEADVYIINTCSVTNIADRKSRQMLHRAKKKNPHAIVVAAGCYVQTATEQAKKDASIDILIGNNQKQHLVALLEEYENRKKHLAELLEEYDHRKQQEAELLEECDHRKKQEAENHEEYDVRKQEMAAAFEGNLVDVIDINHKQQSYEELKVSSPTDHTRAFLKVQDGCNQFCSYCIIPYARGRVRSRAMDDVLAETRRLAENGFQEIVLTGIHLSSYGVDCGTTLLELITNIHQIEGICRIRLGSLEPGIITEEFVAAIASMEKVCPHFHLSLQSGSDTVLRRMNRKYTTSAYAEKCALLRKYFSNPALTTDIIVGFPGETDEEFAETLAFVQQISFYEIHVFKYSKRDGTAAARMKEQIPEAVKTKRSHSLMEAADRLKEAYVCSYRGKQVEVLFEDCVVVDGVSYYEGYTPEYVKVRIQTEESLANKRRIVAFPESFV